jgi:hypothetical protein
VVEPTHPLTFADFVGERQSIWHRRTVAGLPGPWTDDPVLASYRFTNVQRELDRGTITVCNEIAAADATTEQKLFNVIAYRVINRDDVWRERVGFVYDLAELRERWAGLRDFYEAGGHVWSSAWATAPLPALPGDDRLDRVLWAAERWDVSTLDLTADTRSIFKATRKLPAIGDVIAWQATLDFGFVDHVSQDEWVPMYTNLGKAGKSGVGTRSAKARPGGSMVGAELVRPDADPLGTCIALRDEQDDWLPESWSATCWTGKPRLTLADVEHSLCEYSKYHRKATGAKTYMRRFP